MHELHRKAAEQHELAAKAHRSAAEHSEIGENPAHNERALQHSGHAYQLAQEAHEKSGQSETL